MKALVGFYGVFCGWFLWELATRFIESLRDGECGEVQPPVAPPPPFPH